MVMEILELQHEISETVLNYNPNQSCRGDLLIKFCGLRIRLARLHTYIIEELVTY